MYGRSSLKKKGLFQVSNCGERDRYIYIFLVGGFNPSEKY